MSSVSDLEITMKLTYQIKDFPESKRSILNQVLDQRRAEVQASHPPIEDNRKVLHNENVHLITYDTVNRNTASEYVIVIDSLDESSIDSSRVVRYNDLPSVDRERISKSLIGTGTQHVYNETEEEKSIIVPNTKKDVIVWDSSTKAVVTVKSKETVISEAKFIYTSDLIGSAKEYGLEFRRQHEFPLAGLSDSEKEIIKESISSSNGYILSQREDQTPTPSSPFEDLVERFQSQQDNAFGFHGNSPPDGVSGYYLPNYDNEVYLARLVVNAAKLF